MSQRSHRQTQPYTESPPVFRRGEIQPLNKEQHTLALMIDIMDARQMALAALNVIQTWQMVRLLKEWSVITLPVTSEPQQLTLLDPSE